ncbi:hypothetical protein IHE45_15G125100 [Dioscorea alata]|uniref:Uncharacterized protein n=2 Tax=Dioscorea alata TaxID=55571 RepID=A0ACB7UP53_DIOAL|nr:hypothetical protein IHE45_15G125100 [Dioscorea alata]KAH7662297.1 hypothetical protein IHE45_15G125100 [Dioscorea alata]
MKFLRLVFPSSFFGKNQLKKLLESNVSVDKQNEEKKSSESNVCIPKQDEPKQSLGDNVSLCEQNELEQSLDSNFSMPKLDEMEQSLGNNVSVAERNEMGQLLGNNVSEAELNEMVQSLESDASILKQNELKLSAESMPKDPGATVTSKSMEAMTVETFVESPTFLGSIQNSSSDLDESFKISSGFNETTGPIANTTPAGTGKKTKKKKKKNRKSRKKQKDTPPGTVNLPDCTVMADYQTPRDGMRNPIYDLLAPKYDTGCSTVIPKSEGSSIQFSKIGDHGFVHNDPKESSDVVVMKDKCLACKTVDDTGNPKLSGKHKSAINTIPTSAADTASTGCKTTLVCSGEAIKSETKSLDELSYYHKVDSEEVNRDVNIENALRDVNVGCGGRIHTLTNPLRPSFTNSQKQSRKDNARYIWQESKENCGGRLADDRSYNYQQPSMDANSPGMSGLLTLQCTEGYQIEQIMDKSQIIGHELQSVEHILQLESQGSVSHQSSLGQCKATSMTNDTENAKCVTVHEGDHALSTNKHIPELDYANDGHVSCFDETESYYTSNNQAAGNSKCIGAETASGNLAAETSRFLGAEMTVQTLNTAYMLQLASNSFPFVTGRQVAEFERLLFSVSPVIINSFVLQHGWESIGYEPTSIPSCKLKNLKIKLQDIWSWYEDSSCFGLRLKAEVPQKIRRMGMVSIAHFCPFLSAVQLFSSSGQSLLGSSQVNDSCEMPGGSRTAQSAFLTISCPEPTEDVPLSDVLDLMVKYMRPVDIDFSSGKNYSITNSPLDTFDPPELIFEYFEHERPHERKSLYEKIKELSKYGTYNPQVYGDPSKLVHMDLQDLHPTSWFAVAWYPIYTIPEKSANLRAAFLTYHSFGHLVLRHIQSDALGDNAFCAVAPALGMQTYNAKEEGWLDVTTPPESLLEVGINLDSTRIVEERVRALQETAVLYSTGNVRKNQKTVSNRFRHRDFEFFSSRSL